MRFRSASNSAFREFVKDSTGPGVAFRTGEDAHTRVPTQAPRCGGIFKNPALLFAIFSGAAVCIYGQPGLPVELRNLPAWPGSAAAAKTFANQYVFRDGNGEIVVSYPDPSDPARSATFRFWLQNRVDPRISISIKRSSDGEFTYDYTLENGLAAKTGIWSWSVVGPPSTDLVISHPTWHGLNPFQAVAAPQPLLTSAGTGVYLSWNGASDPIAPGGKLFGFEIVSRLRPGLTTAYARGWEAPIHPPTELTEDVAEQITPLERAPVMDKVALAIGPRFAADLNNRDILSVYQADIRDLANNGFLNGKSPFIQELQQLLTRAIASYPGPIETPKEAPQTPIEKELMVALKPALRPE